MWRFSASLASASVLLVGALIAAGAAQSANAEDPVEPAARAIVELHAPGTSRALDAAVSRHGLDVTGRIPATGQLAVELAPGESLNDLRARLAADPRIERVEADRPVEFRHVPSDLAFGLPDPNAPGGDFALWHLRRSGAPAAWDLSRGAGAEVAVIDSGAEVGHPDLSGRVAGTLGNVSDSTGHGTHVAALACGDSGGGGPLASMGYDCNLFIVKVGLCSSVASGIVAAANRGSDAINLSIGGCGPEIADEVRYAWDRGSVPVVAGDNVPVPSPNYPAQAVQPEGSGPNLASGRGLVVTAARHDGARASFAQRTTGVSVAAFGAGPDSAGGRNGILSAWPAATTDYETGTLEIPPCACRTTLAGDNRFAYLSGTSMAAPQVAGVVALMRAIRPSISATRIVRLIKLTARNCARYGGGLGWGVIDAHGAVAAAAERDASAPASRIVRATRKHLVLKRFERSCSDELPSSGVKTVNVFASVGGKRYRRIGKTAGKTLRFRAKPGRRYRFYSVAVDGAGNREARPASPDAKLRSPKKGKRKRR